MVPKSAGGGRRLVWATVALVIVHVLWVFLEVLSRLDAEFAGLHSEELANPWMTRMLLAGHWEHWTELRYRSFCGGCGVAGTMGVPLFAAFGQTVVAWKLVPLAFHAAVVGFSVSLARSWWGGLAGVLVAALWLGAPSLFLELSTLGWANHAEVMALVLGGLWVLGRGDHLGRVVFAGVLVGFGIWFCRTGVIGLPAAVFVLWRGRAGLRLLAAFLAALAVTQMAHFNGASATFRHREPLRPEVFDVGGLLSSSVELLRWMVGPVVSGRVWPLLSDSGSSLPWLYWMGLLVGVPLVVVVGFVRSDADQRRRLAIPLLLLFAWGAGMAFGHAHWRDTVQAVGSGAFYLRYLTPAFVVLVLTLSVGASVQVPPWLRRAVWVVPVVGVGLRIASVEPPRFDLMAQPIPVDLGRAPDFETAPLEELRGLLSQRRGEPVELRERYVEIVTERYFQAHMDHLEAAAEAGGLGRDAARELRKAVETRDPVDALERLGAAAAHPAVDIEFAAFPSDLDWWERRATMKHLLPRTVARGSRGVMVTPEGWLDRYREQLSGDARSSLDHALGEHWSGQLALQAGPDGPFRGTPDLTRVAREYRAGACFAIGTRLGLWRELERKRSQPHDELAARAPSGCVQDSLRSGIEFGAWTAAGCRRGRGNLEVEGRQLCGD